MSTHILPNTKNKYCSKCDSEKPLAEFNKDKNRKDGKMIFCKECIVKYSKIIRKRHNQKRTEYNKKYREENRKKYNDWEKDYYNKNNKKMNRTAKKWRITNGRYKIMHLAAQSRARKKNIQYELNPEMIEICIMFQQNKCAITGIEFNHNIDENYNCRPFAPSIDRIENSKGYVLDNIQIVCNMVNKAKNIYKMEIFDEMCRKRMEKLNGY